MYISLSYRLKAWFDCAAVWSAKKTTLRTQLRFSQEVCKYTISSSKATNVSEYLKINRFATSFILENETGHKNCQIRLIWRHWGDQISLNWWPAECSVWLL